MKIKITIILLFISFLGYSQTNSITLKEKADIPQKDVNSYVVKDINENVLSKSKNTVFIKKNDSTINIVRKRRNNLILNYPEAIPLSPTSDSASKTTNVLVVDKKLNTADTTRKMTVTKEDD